MSERTNESGGKPSASAPPAESAELSWMEKAALSLGRFSNERPGPKRFQNFWLERISFPWVYRVLAPRMLVSGLPELLALDPPRGILTVANHRSFFDQYALLLSVFAQRPSFAANLFFPVRSNFFYEGPLGVAVNYAVAAGSMYPPIYRQTERRELNDDALDRSIRLLQTRGNLVGIHPEGTRGKGEDPYALLPAQPGVGKIALLANPTIIPWFILGLGNSFAQDVRLGFDKTSRRTHPVIVIIGKPIDISDLVAQKARPTLYKKCADRLMGKIAELIPEEKALRAQCAAGDISDDDPRWLTNVPTTL